MKTEAKKIYLPDIVGKGYGDFWKFKGRFRVVKGSRASKKSTTAALNLIYRIMQYPQANALVVRKTFATIKDSCYTQLKWAIRRLGVEKYWKARLSPLEIEYIPTGQKILFRGLDDPLKITSITVDVGVLCWGLVEEAYEIDNEQDFNRLDESLRGELPDGYFIQWTIIFNPWDRNHWLKARFFDRENENVLAKTTNYLCNEFLSAADLAMFEDMKRNDPERYKVAGLGEWGIAEGQFFDCWRSDLHVVKPFKIPDGWIRFRAMDWGSYHPYAVLWFAIDYDGNLWCYRELYGWGGRANVGTKETAEQVAEKIAAAEGNEQISYGVLDNACWAATGVTGPSIAEAINNVLWQHKRTMFGECSKGREAGAEQFRQRLIGYEDTSGQKIPAIRFFSTCIHSARTIPMLTHDKHQPEKYDTQGEDHCFIAGTMVTTARGDVPIEQVTTSDYVLTRKGYRPVAAASMTRRNAPVMTLVASNGATLTGTGNHPIYVQGKGFVDLGAIEPRDELLHKQEIIGSDATCLEQRKQKQQIASYSTEPPFDGIQTLKTGLTVCTTGQAADCESEVSRTCITRFGKLITEKYRKASTFIIKTVIRQTMIFQTLLSFLRASTCQGIRLSAFAKIRDGLKTLWPKPGTRQRYGMDRQKDENGTGSTDLKRLPSEKAFQRLQRPARNAAEYTKRLPTETVSVNTAQRLAIQSTAEIAASTTKQGAAQYAAMNLLSTDTVKSKPAASNAVRALCLTTAGKADVYNLTVDGVHEYFANGILVHNCADAAVYGCLSRPYTPENPADKAYKPRDDYKHEEAPSSWAL